MQNRWLTLMTGFALFSMFFGSGNLVFPITVGQESGGYYLLAAFGIILTGVLVPFMGVLGMMLYNGDIYSFFQSFGKKGTFIFSFLALALMGPFGVLARCLTVAHGALLLLFPNISLPLASFLMCLVIFALAVKKNKIVSVLGSVLTPFLLISIAAIAFFGLTTEHSVTPDLNVGKWMSLKNGFFQGYQTMDLLASFFFSQFIITHLRNKTSESENASSAVNSSTLNVFYKSSLIGAGILSTVYFALVVLGWEFSSQLAGTPPQEMLAIIAMESLGSLAAPCVCLAVMFACLTTAIVLASLFADFLQKEVSKEKLSNPLALIITLAIGFSVSTLEFAGIAKFLGPILEAVYPALIVLTAVNIMGKFYGVKANHWPFTLTIVAKLAWL